MKADRQLITGVPAAVLLVAVVWYALKLSRCDAKLHELEYRINHCQLCDDQMKAD